MIDSVHPGALRSDASQNKAEAVDAIVYQRVTCVAERLERRHAFKPDGGVQWTFLRPQNKQTGHTSRQDICLSPRWCRDWCPTRTGGSSRTVTGKILKSIRRWPGFRE